VRSRVYRLAPQWAVSLALITQVTSIAGAQSVVSGIRAPEIDLPALTGDRVKLSALRGHPVVVTFWGTYCPPCRDEFPILVKAQQRHAATGLRVLGVNGRDQEFSTKDVQKFVQEFGALFPIALDVRGKARRDFLVLGLPTTVFIDTSGVIRGIHRGPIGVAALDSGVAAILPSPPERDPQDG
jgi:thiol-disulfide isomerase/thioredoxin